MYAIAEINGKQYRFADGDKVRVDRMEGEKGDEIVLDRILAVVDDNHCLNAGHPYIEGASVKAQIVEKHRERKIVVFKYAKRKRRRIKTGSRRFYTTLKINEIKL